LTKLSDSDAWKWIYAEDDRLRKEREAIRKPEICFTGFTPEEKEALISLAVTRGFDVKSSVTVLLKILVTGGDPGPSKLKKARKIGCLIISGADFIDEKYEM